MIMKNADKNPNTVDQAYTRLPVIVSKYPAKIIIIPAQKEWPIYKKSCVFLKTKIVCGC